MNLLFIGDLKTTTTLFVCILWVIGAFIPFIVAYGLANKELSLGGELPKSLKNTWAKTGWLWALAIAGIVFLFAEAFINKSTRITSDGVFRFGNEPWFWLCLLVILANGIINLVIVVRLIKGANNKG